MLLWSKEIKRKKYQGESELRLNWEDDISAGIWRISRSQSHKEAEHLRQRLLGLMVENRELCLRLWKSDMCLRARDKGGEVWDESGEVSRDRSGWALKANVKDLDLL